jgi:hypothetical protein
MQGINMLKAKPLLKDRFWIVEDEGLKIGTLSKDSDGYLLVKSGETKHYDNKKQLVNIYGVNFFSKSSITLENKQNDSPYEVYGYPARVMPVDPTYDIHKKLPLFKKSKLAKSIFCAGYYAVKFESNWFKSFCPKLVTLETNSYLGPFRSKEELKKAFRGIDGTVKHKTN